METCNLTGKKITMQSSVDETDTFSMRLHRGVYFIQFNGECIDNAPLNIVVTPDVHRENALFKFIRKMTQQYGEERGDCMLVRVPLGDYIICMSFNPLDNSALIGMYGVYKPIKDRRITAYWTLLEIFKEKDTIAFLHDLHAVMLKEGHEQNAVRSIVRGGCDGETELEIRVAYDTIDIGMGSAALVSEYDGINKAVYTTFERNGKSPHVFDYIRSVCETHGTEVEGEKVIVFSPIGHEEGNSYTLSKDKSKVTLEGWVLNSANRHFGKAQNPTSITPVILINELYALLKLEAAEDVSGKEKEAKRIAVTRNSDGPVSTKLGVNIFASYVEIDILAPTPIDSDTCVDFYSNGDSPQTFEVLKELIDGYGREFKDCGKVVCIRTPHSGFTVALRRSDPLNFRGVAEIEVRLEKFYENSLKQGTARSFIGQLPEYALLFFSDLKLAMDQDNGIPL
jgi:hypothetical protein